MTMHNSLIVDPGNNFYNRFIYKRFHWTPHKLSSLIIPKTNKFGSNDGEEFIAIIDQCKYPLHK